jgi:hypothetical protein
MSGGGAAWGYLAEGGPIVRGEVNETFTDCYLRGYKRA